MGNTRYFTDWEASTHVIGEDVATKLTMRFGAMRISLWLNDSEKIALLALLTGASQSAQFEVSSIMAPLIKANQPGKYVMLDMDTLNLRRLGA